MSHLGKTSKTTKSVFLWRIVQKWPHHPPPPFLPSVLENFEIHFYQPICDFADFCIDTQLKYLPNTQNFWNMVNPPDPAPFPSRQFMSKKRSKYRKTKTTSKLWTPVEPPLWTMSKRKTPFSDVFPYGSETTNNPNSRFVQYKPQIIHFHAFLTAQPFFVHSNCENKTFSEKSMVRAFNGRIKKI